MSFLCYLWNQKKLQNNYCETFQTLFKKETQMVETYRHMHFKCSEKVVKTSGKQHVFSKQHETCLSASVGL